MKWKTAYEWNKFMRLVNTCGKIANSALRITYFVLISGFHWAQFCAHCCLRSKHFTLHRMNKAIWLILMFELRGVFLLVYCMAGWVHGINAKDIKWKEKKKTHVKRECTPGHEKNDSANIKQWDTFLFIYTNRLTYACTHMISSPK